MMDRFFCGSRECDRDMRHEMRDMRRDMSDDCFRPTESVGRDVFVRETRTLTSWQPRPDCTCDDGMRR